MLPLCLYFNVADGFQKKKKKKLELSNTKRLTILESYRPYLDVGELIYCRPSVHILAFNFSTPMGQFQISCRTVALPTNLPKLFSLVDPDVFLNASSISSNDFPLVSGIETAQINEVSKTHPPNIK